MMLGADSFSGKSDWADSVAVSFDNGNENLFAFDEPAFDLSEEQIRRSSKRKGVDDADEISAKYNKFKLGATPSFATNGANVIEYEATPEDINEGVVAEEGLPVGLPPLVLLDHEVRGLPDALSDTLSDSTDSFDSGFDEDSDDDEERDDEGDADAYGLVGAGAGGGGAGRKGVKTLQDAHGNMAKNKSGGGGGGGRGGGGGGHKKARGNYACSKCGLPKRGHVCHIQPRARGRRGSAAAAAAAAEHASALVSAEWPAINPAARRGVGEMATAQDGDDEVEEVEEEEERTEEDLAASALRRALQIDSPARPKKVATPKGGSVVRATGPTTSSNSLHPPSSTPSSSSVLSSLSPPALAAAAGEDAAVDTLLGLDVAPWLSREYAAALLHLARSPLLSANSPASASSPASPVSSGVNTARDVQAACDLLYDDSSGDLRERLDRIILLGSSSSSGSSSSGRSSGSGSSGAESLVGIVDSSSSCPGSPPRGNASSPAPAGTNSQKRDKKSKPRGVKNQTPSPSPPPQPSSLDAGAASSLSGSREKGGKGKGKGSGSGGGKSVHGKGGKGGASGARR
mmetsp:Transcript_84757/g.169646  ORF Transcript_84757/g.169646 Transcript_84757/m.169646 type:complete len:572 (+) Transcript_84757:151-1866(+)